MAGPSPFGFSASSFLPGGQGTNNQSITPEMLAQLMALMQGGGKGADLSLLSQAITPTQPRFAPLPLPSAGAGRTALTDALTGQPLAGGATAGTLDWAKALAGDINSKVGGPLVNPLVAQPAAAAAAPATNTPLGGTSYRGPNIEDWQKAIQPATDLVNAAGTALQPAVQSLNALGGDIASGKAMDSLGWHLTEAGKWISDTAGGMKLPNVQLPKDMGTTSPGFWDFHWPWESAARNFPGEAVSPQDSLRALADSAGKQTGPFKVDQQGQTGLQNVAANAGNFLLTAIPKAVIPPLANTTAGLLDFAFTPEGAIADAAKKKWDAEHPDQGNVTFNLPGQGGGQAAAAPAIGVGGSGLPQPAPLQTTVGGGTQTAATPATSGGFNPDAYIAGTYNRESGGNWNAVNQQKGATASGAGQFTQGTWMDFMSNKHPDFFGRMSDKDILALRFNPTYMNEAMRWNMDRGIKVLDDLNLPITNGGIYATHMLGPGGARKLLSADPDTPITQVLDAAQIRANPGILHGTVQDVLNNFEASYGDPTRIVQHGPTDRPQLVGPDTAETMKWVEEARPKPADAQLLKNAQFGDMMAGIGQGLGMDFNGGGQLFGNLAAGAGKGLAASSALALTTSQTDEAARAAYAGGRGDLALKLATLQSDLTNGNMDRVWQDRQDLSNWMNQQAQSRLDYRKAQEDASKPKIHTANENYILYTDAQGNPQMIDMRKNDLLDNLDKMSKIYGTDVVRPQKYQYIDQNGDLNMHMMEMAKDAVSDGIAQAVFGPDNYNTAHDLATKELEKSSYTIGTPEYQDALNKRLAGWLFAGAQKSGDTNWVQTLAAYGNPGAISLWNSRTTTPKAPTQ